MSVSLSFMVQYVSFGLCDFQNGQHCLVRKSSGHNKHFEVQYES